MHFTDSICINVNVRTSFNQSNVAYKTFKGTYELLKCMFNLLFRVVKSTLYKGWFLLTSTQRPRVKKKSFSIKNLGVLWWNLSESNLFIYLFFFMWAASSWGDKNTQRKQTINIKWQSIILTNLNDADCQSSLKC